MINQSFVSESKMREIEKKIHALRFGPLDGQSAKLFGSNIMNYPFCRPQFSGTNNFERRRFGITSNLNEFSVSA